LARVRVALHEHPGEHGLATVSEWVGINLSSDSEVVRMMEDSTTVKVIHLPSGELRLAYYPFRGISNRQRLEEELRRESLAGIRVKDIIERTYKKVADDLWDLTQEPGGQPAKVIVMPSSGPGEKVVFWKGDYEVANNHARTAWKAVRVPQGAELQDKLVEMKARTSVQMGKRKRREAQERERQAEAQKKPKKRRRQVVSRNRTNTHLDDPKARP
jgi:hypothetical protein